MHLIEKRLRAPTKWVAKIGKTTMYVRYQYMPRHFRTIKSTASLAAVVLLLTNCTRPCEGQAVVCVAGFAQDSAGICQEIPACPLEYPQEFYTDPGSVLAVPRVPERTIRVDTVMESSATRTFVMSFRFKRTTGWG